MTNMYICICIFKKKSYTITYSNGSVFINEINETFLINFLYNTTLCSILTMSPCRRKTGSFTNKSISIAMKTVIFTVIEITTPTFTWHFS